jgi:hypothetical protein
MNGFFYISALLIGFNSLSCHSQDSETKKNVSWNNAEGDLYVSNYGEVRILKMNDTLFQTSFKNNEGHEFDTTMTLIQDDSVFLYQSDDSNSFTLRYNWGGLFFSNDQIQVYDFAGYGMLGAQTEMWDMYYNPFYKVDTKHTIKGLYQRSKSIQIIDDVHVLDRDMTAYQYYELKGEIKKEKWPIEFYSTNESPQGVIGNDTSELHYRLVLKNWEDVTPVKRIFKGSSINISTGDAAIAWDFADSEAFILDGHAPWTKEEELKSITVEGVLIQNEKGSFLKNWKIIE